MLQFFYIVPFAMLRKVVDKRTEHTDTCVTGCTAAKSYNDMLCTSSDGISHKLTRTVTGSHHRIPFFPGKQRQSAGLCYFYHGKLSVKQILCRNGSHQRISGHQLYQIPTDSRMKSLHKAFTAIADRHLNNFCVRPTVPNTLCCCLIGLF